MPNGPSRAPYSTGFQYDSIVPPERQVYFCIYPGKLAWNLKIPPCKKEKHLQTTNFVGSMLVSRGIRMLLLHHQNFPNISNDPPELSSAVQQQHCDFRGCYCSGLPAWCTGTRVARNNGIYVPANQHVPTQDHPRYV